MRGILQARDGKGVGRLPLFSFDIFKDGIVREITETFILIYVLSEKRKSDTLILTVNLKHSRPSVQHE